MARHSVRKPAAQVEPVTALRAAPRSRQAKPATDGQTLAIFLGLMNREQLEAYIDQVRTQWRLAHGLPADEAEKLVIKEMEPSVRQGDLIGGMHTLWANLHSLDLDMETGPTKSALIDAKASIIGALQPFAFTGASSATGTRFILVRQSRINDGALNAFAWNDSEDVLRRTPMWTSDTSPFPHSLYEGPIGQPVMLPSAFPVSGDKEPCDVYARSQ